MEKHKSTNYNQYIQTIQIHTHLMKVLAPTHIVCK